MKPLYFPVLAIFAMSLALPAAAQDAAGTPVLLRGTIDSVSGSTMAMTTREGEKINVTLGDQMAVGYNTQKTAADLTEGVILGTTTITGPDGKPQALEVHVLDQSPDMHQAWDLAPNSTMTNGRVTEAANEGDNRVITVHYKTAEGEGDWQVTIPPQTPVVHMEMQGDRSLLVPGSYVFLSAQKMADGTYVANFALAEKDGVKAPL